MEKKVGIIGHTAIHGALASLLLSKASEAEQQVIDLRGSKLTQEDRDRALRMNDNSSVSAENLIVIIDGSEDPNEVIKWVNAGHRVMNQEEYLQLLDSKVLEVPESIPFRKREPLKIELPDVKEAMFMDYEFKKSARAQRRSDNRKGKGKKKHGYK